MLMSNLIFYTSLRITVEEPAAAREAPWVNGLRNKLREKRQKCREELEWWLETRNF